MDKIKILILEDNDSDLDLVMYELKKLKTGKDEIICKNKNEYIKALEEYLPDIVLSDYNLPDINGEEALELLREKSSDIPFILVSATIGEEKAVELMRNGANDFIMKDNLKKLVPTIEREIKGYENRKQAKKEHLELIESRNSLRVSEKKFRSLAENSLDRIERYDRECRHIYINPESLKVTGFKYDEVIGKTHKDLGYRQTDYEFWDSLVMSVINTGRPNGSVLDMKTENNIKYYDWKLYPEFDDSGTVVSVLSISRDITEIKMSEIEVKRTVEKLTRAENIANIGYWELDYRTGRMEASEGTRKIYGLPSDKKLYLGEIQKCAVTDYRSMLSKALKELIDYHFEYDVEFKIITADRQELKDIRSVAVFDRTQNKIFGVIHDITEIKEAHKELVKLTTAVNQSPSIIIMTDTKGDVEYVNPRFTEVTGYSLDEVKNKSPRILKYGEMTDEEYSELWNTITDGRVWKGELLNRKKSGELYWEGATVGPVFDNNGKIINYLKLSQDITDKIQLVEELLKEKESLELSNKELEQFAYIASHDLQEPLRIISSFSQLLEMKHSHRLNEEARGYLKYLVSGSKRMQNLIKGLLEYSRITSKTKPRTLINLSEPLQNAICNLNLTLHETGTELIIKELPEVSVEPDQIAHIFQNLIGNAIKFRKEDEKCIIEIGSEKEISKNEWIIYVKDNGTGIENEDIEKVFVIFNRLAAAAKKPGDGIGLALCKRIIEKQGGKIWVESEGGGKGSVFKFTIPATERNISG